MPPFTSHAFTPLTQRILLRLWPATAHALGLVRQPVHVERISLRTFAAFGVLPAA